MSLSSTTTGSLVSLWGKQDRGPPAQLSRRPWSCLQVVWSIPQIPNSTLPRSQPASEKAHPIKSDRIPRLSVLWIHGVQIKREPRSSLPRSRTRTSKFNWNAAQTKKKKNGGAVWGFRRRSMFPPDRNGNPLLEVLWLPQATGLGYVCTSL